MVGCEEWGGMTGEREEDFVEHFGSSLLEGVSWLSVLKWEEGWSHEISFFLRFLVRSESP